MEPPRRLKFHVAGHPRSAASAADPGAGQRGCIFPGHRRAVSARDGLRLGSKKPEPQSCVGSTKTCFGVVVVPVL